MGRSTKYKREHTPQSDKAIKDLVNRMNREVRIRGLDKDPERLYNASFFDMLDPSVMIQCMIEMQMEINKYKARYQPFDNMSSRSSDEAD